MKKLFVILYTAILLLTGCHRVEIPAETAAPTPTLNTDPPSTDVIATEPTEQVGEPDSPKSSVSFLACGDNMVFYGNIRDAASQPGEYRYNFASHYKYVRDIISSADISMINQETLMSNEHQFSYYPRFNSPREMGYALIDAGFDVIGIANNHMLDKDKEEDRGGLLSTIRFWREQPVTLIGGYTSEEDSDNIRIVEKNGIKVAFLAYTEHTNGGTTPDGTFIPYMSESLIKRQISAAKERADFVIVSAHWGDEYTFTPNDRQRSYARIMTEAGADVIIGHHPHVIQPIEWLTASDGSRTLCAYSLGNFVAEQANDYNMLGGMISLNLVKSGDATTVDDVVFIPTVYYFDTNFYNNCVYLMDDFTDDLAESHGISHYENTITVEGLHQYLRDTISEEFLAR